MKEAGMAACGNYDERWHEDLEGRVDKHHEAIHGNGDLGLKSRVTGIEAYIVDRKHDRKWLIGILGGILVLLGHDLLKDMKVTLTPPTVQTQTSTTTDSSTTSTTKTQKPTER